MTLEEELLALRRTVSRQQHFIGNQRARERAVRRTRLALVSGSHAAQVDPQAEEAKAATFLTGAEDSYRILLRALKYYAEGGSDAGLRARAVLEVVQ